MGSNSGEHPDDVLRENHEMLAAVHSGRSELRSLFFFFSFFGKFSASLSVSCVFLSPLVLSKWSSHFFSSFYCFDSIEQAQASHVYSYKHAFRGFAAKLSEEQASQISSMS